MDDQDAFAVWIASAVLRADNQEFAADALTSLAEGVTTPRELDEKLKPSHGGARRPGDFGLEILGPLIPLVLVEFGRSLWQAYVNRLAEQGGKALADVTLARVKGLARGMWSGEEALSPDQIERRLRDAAAAAGLDGARTEALVASFRSPGMKHELGE